MALTAPAAADEPPVDTSPALFGPVEPSLIERTGDIAATVVDGVNKTIGQTIDHAIDYVGIRYRRGGQSPETGFDCSGFVSHVFREAVGLILPHNAKAMSRSGDVVRKNELQPGDLVFFNTMRRAFSHVGIYLGDNRFIHSPAPGGEVRVEDMGSRYWKARFNGARRFSVE
jgi:cell wall-associated NlpC family hydrolase